jgi:hypothetical protein
MSGKIEEARMAELCCASDREQVVDIMIALTRPSPLDSVIVAGSESMELYLSLRRRGFGRAATPATCRTPRRRYAIGLVMGQNLMGALAQASLFLTTNAIIAVLIDSREGEFSMKIRHKLQQMGFRIEAGVRCQRGLVLSADRRGFSQMEQAA